MSGIEPRADVLFDATRLVSRVGLSAPTGIDRVDLAYLQAIAAMPDVALHLVVVDVFGPQLLPPAAAGALLQKTGHSWRSPAARSSSAFDSIQHWLRAAGDEPAPRLRAPGNGAESPLRATMHALTHPVGAWRLRRLIEPRRRPALYLNASHGRSFRSALSRWLQRHAIGGLFFVHDLIPLQHPEYNRRPEPARHAARLATVATHARAVVVNSEATRTSLLNYWQAQGRRAPPVHALHLGAEPMLKLDGVQPIEPVRPYFVMVGTIEPRKNHQLLLNLWRRMVETEGFAAPRLVLIGRRGWENQTLFNLLDRTPALAAHVAECSGLTDGEVATLVAGARALLNPSWAEGYGLPVAEALALGTPALVSDLPAHREVGGDFAEYIDPLDGSGWLKAIREYAAEPSPRREFYRHRLVSYRAPSWDEHLSQATGLIREAAQLT